MLKIKVTAVFFVVSVTAVFLSGCAANLSKGPAAEERKAAEKAASDLFLEGKMAETNEDWAKAVVAYTEALQYDPQSDEIAAALAKVFLRDSKNRSALYYTKMAIRLNSSESEYWKLLQYLEQQDGNFEEAAEALEESMKLSGERQFVDVMRLAQYYFAMGKENEAKKILLSQAKDRHTTAEEMFEIGSMFAYSGMTDEAASVYKTVIERDPLDIQAWLYLGDLFAFVNRGDEAMQTYMNALEKNPENLMVIVKIGNHCLMENDWECAVIYFKKAADAGSEAVEEAGITYMEILKTLTAVYYYSGKDEEGTALFESLKESGNDDARLYFSLAKTMNYLERYEEAVEYFRIGFSRDIQQIQQDSLFRAYTGYAMALINSDRGDEALELVRDQAVFNIEEPSGIKELEASIYMELKRYDDAISIYEWLLATDPENRGYLLSLSLVYDLSGNFSKAENALLNVLEKEPEDALALNNLAYMYLENGRNFSKALEMAKQAIIQAPNNGAYLDTIGWAYYKLGKYKQARKNIENALKWSEKHDRGIIYEHYGDILVKLGKEEEALDAYRKAIDSGEDEERILPKMNSIPK